MNNFVIWFEKLGMNDVEIVGGKNASLGEMISNLADSGVMVPGGYATTADAYREFLKHEGLADRINKNLAELDVDNIKNLTAAGKQIRQWIMDAPFPPQLEKEIGEGYVELEKRAGENVSVAVRSSATAEDLPDASFAGQQETFLNIRGIDDILLRVKEVFASLYNDRAIAYRVHQGFEHEVVALSAGIQQMVRSDLGSSGVMFTLDTESGFDDVVFITSSFGLGECVVQGSVNPDEFYAYKPALEAGKQSILRRNMGSKAEKMIFDESGDNPTIIVEVPELERMKFSLNDDDIEELARYALTIEKHYGRPMDIEWGKDGENNKLYILQARPETVKSRTSGKSIERYIMKERSDILVTGRSIGQRIGSGPIKIISDIQYMDEVKEGDVLVTDMTDPDWEPVMKRASAIVTNRGGRTCHAAIIARELGIPAVVGTSDGTEKLANTDAVTVSCSEGDTGFIYEGILPFELKNIKLDSMPDINLKIMMNVGNPDRAFDFASYPNHGVGLARLEFIINRMIGVHPKALINMDTMPNNIKTTIQKRISGYSNPIDFFITKLTEGIATLGAAFAPNPVIVRMSDFKSNEYYNLIGGDQFEPKEENPMLGFRGASRYVSESFRDCFEMECKAFVKVRNDMGLTNVQLMVPFVRTVDEAKQVIELLKENGLERGKDGLKIIMMCELPSNAILAKDFLEYFDGFSIGSNDLTQLTLGLDRDSGLVADKFDERNPAVKAMLQMSIKACLEAKKYIGICGQGPSDHPDLAQWLMEQGIESISLNPDTVIETWLSLAGESI
ncbi:MAG TPA: phosphoenolpyruvate synthase [Thiotrichaceae bacterium]|jgi:pyruvate,water dikinase|nr:phosphoenolpyruvate synthase [Thiotrichaceae bacterium]HIM08060.1 phosphoenolpyruvate synthase [Gammaproteobacteria bacterium]